MTRTDCLIAAAVAEIERNRAIIDRDLDEGLLGGLSVVLKLNECGVVRASWIARETEPTKTGAAGR